MVAAVAGQRPTAITVVRAAACHFCEEAQAALAEIAVDYPLRIELVEAGEPRGAALLAEHRAGMFPLVVVDSAFFSAGRLPRKKLRKLLEARRSGAVA